MSNKYLRDGHAKVKSFLNSIDYERGFDDESYEAGIADKRYQ